MTLREAEKAVLEAAEKWLDDPTPELATAHDRLVTAIRAYRAIKSAGKPKALCYCGKTVSIEGDHLRHHSRGDAAWGHSPRVSYVLKRGGKLL